MTFFYNNSQVRRKSLVQHHFIVVITIIFGLLSIVYVHSLDEIKENNSSRIISSVTFDKNFFFYDQSISYRDSTNSRRVLDESNPEPTEDDSEPTPDVTNPVGEDKSNTGDDDDSNTAEVDGVSNTVEEDGSNNVGEDEMQESADESMEDSDKELGLETVVNEDEEEVESEANPLVSDRGKENVLDRDFESFATKEKKIAPKKATKLENEDEEDSPTIQNGLKSLKVSSESNTKQLDDGDGDEILPKGDNNQASDETNDPPVVDEIKETPSDGTLQEKGTTKPKKKKKKKNISIGDISDNKSVETLGTDNNNRCEADTCEICANLTKSFSTSTLKKSKTKNITIVCVWHDNACSEIEIKDVDHQKALTVEKMCPQMGKIISKEEQLCNNEITCNGCQSVKFQKGSSTKKNALTCWWNKERCELSNTTTHPEQSTMCTSEAEKTSTIDETDKNDTTHSQDSSTSTCDEATSCNACKKMTATLGNDEFCWWDGDQCTLTTEDEHDVLEFRKMCSSTKKTKKIGTKSDTCNTATSCNSCSQLESSNKNAICWWNGTDCYSSAEDKKDPHVMCACEDIDSCSDCSIRSDELRDPNNPPELVEIKCWWNQTTNTCTRNYDETLDTSPDAMCPRSFFDCSLLLACKDCQANAKTGSCFWDGKQCTQSSFKEIEPDDIVTMCVEDVEPDAASDVKSGLKGSDESNAFGTSTPSTSHNTPISDSVEKADDVKTANPSPSSDDATPKPRSSPDFEDSNDYDHTHSKSGEKSVDPKPNTPNPSPHGNDDTLEPTLREIDKVQDVEDSGDSEQNHSEEETEGSDLHTNPEVTDEPTVTPTESPAEPPTELSQPSSITPINFDDDELSGAGAIFFVAFVSVAGYCLFRRCRSSRTNSLQNGFRQQPQYQGISTVGDDDDEEWGWDESPNKPGKVEITGMNLNSNSSSHLTHRPSQSDHSNGSRTSSPEMTRRTYSSQSQNSSKNGITSSPSSNKPSATSVRQKDDFFEQMGLAAKPKLSVSSKQQTKHIQTKQMPPILAPKQIKAPPVAPVSKKSNKLGATTISSDVFEDIGDDDWGDDDADLDDLLKD